MVEPLGTSIEDETGRTGWVRERAEAQEMTFDLIKFILLAALLSYWKHLVVLDVAYRLVKQRTNNKELPPVSMGGWENPPTKREQLCHSSGFRQKEKRKKKKKK